MSVVASFLVGFLVGRRAEAKVEQVDPQIAFLPITELSMSNVEEVVYGELKKLGLSDEVARAALKRLFENPMVREALELYRRKMAALRVIKGASKALEEGRISPQLFGALIQKYRETLVEVDKRLSELLPKLEAALAAPVGFS